MSHRSRILFCSRDTARSERIETLLGEQGVALNHVEIDHGKGPAFEKSGANVLIVDFNDTGAIAEPDFRSLWSAAQHENLKIIYLTESQDSLPDFAPTEDASVQILAGPAQEQQLLSRLRLMTRLETMAEEIVRRSETLGTFGINTPYDIDAFEKKAANILLVAEPSTDFARIENAVSGEDNTVVGAYTRAMALDYLEQKRFDLIVYDVTGDLDALIDFISLVRLDSRFFNIPFLVLCNEDEVGDPAKLYRIGATEISFKPINQASLANASKALIREHRYHRHLISIYYASTEDGVLDEQTGLFRHGFLMDHLTGLVKQADQTDASLTVAFLDILHLDAINRQYGYAGGDALIRQVGNLISRLFRGEDLCARYGGEEFVVILPRTRVAEAVPAVRRLISTANTTQFQLVSGAPPVNFSLTFGLTEYEHGDTAETIIARARQITLRE